MLLWALGGFLFSLFFRWILWNKLNISSSLNYNLFSFRVSHWKDDWNVYWLYNRYDILENLHFIHYLKSCKVTTKLSDLIGIFSIFLLNTFLPKWLDQVFVDQLINTQIFFCYLLTRDDSLMTSNTQTSPNVLPRLQRSPHSARGSLMTLITTLAPWPMNKTNAFI